MRGLLMALPVPAFSACDTPVGILIARDQAKVVVNGIVEDKMPGVDAGTNSGCVVENATADEVNALARYAVIGSDEQTATIIRGVLSRPETQQCLSARAPGAAATF